ncbi:hypothetical protein BABINDRAFT_159657 [Babjeviella inositovora NRRL Y-12698]|uniref:Uncharacterized protein n=1 Tax=Babjeviella inositovora NRRL Y-12698 TaxID=984486 RepID=A0A1E3QZV8_9ASCO|nr:uncharacterized protein BABINDRAFT_159657 [Babjeviella inositovora NRRL Y-12698]ODQ83220.1 hypothetical protein BABINDRAFT_159657 [Babjeviella inositovora NRRL Y-12698]
MEVSEGIYTLEWLVVISSELKFAPHVICRTPYTAILSLSMTSGGTKAKAGNDFLHRELDTTCTHTHLGYLCTRKRLLIPVEHRKRQVSTIGGHRSWYWCLL